MNVSKTRKILKALEAKSKSTLLDKPKHIRAEKNFIKAMKSFKRRNKK